MRTVYLDTETTGLRGVYAGGRDEIVELAILNDRGKPIINKLVRPAHRNSWPEAERIHGISPEMVADAPTLQMLLPEVSAAVSGCRVVIYNAAFDVRFFPSHLFLDSQVVCAMLRYAEWNGEWNDYYGHYRWHKLHVAAAATGFNEDVQWHRALADTIACRHVWRHLVRSKFAA